MFDIRVTADVKKLAKDFSFFAQGQIPFATAKALNAVAERVRDEERANMLKVFDGPTPFTINAVRIKKATKAKPEATVFVMDKTAEYLEPYENGGLNKLNSRALLKPVKQKVNQYGNLPARALQRLNARKDVFVGKVKTKNGVVNGFWQRTKVKRGKPGGLKLLVKFEDAHEAKQRLNYRAVAKRSVDAGFKREFLKAMDAALQSAR
ncbi:hypothetical protein ACFPAA_20940 [Paraburkholderia caffeinitolerans]